MSGFPRRATPGSHPQRRLANRTGLHPRHQVQNIPAHFSLACLTTGNRMTSPHVSAGVHAKALPALFGAVCRQWTEATEVVLPHAFQRHAVVFQYLLDVNAFLDGSEIYPLAAHFCPPSPALVRTSNGFPLLSTAIK